MASVIMQLLLDDKLRHRIDQAARREIEQQSTWERVTHEDHATIRATAADRSLFQGDYPHLATS